MILKFFAFGIFWCIIAYFDKTSVAHFSWPQGRIPYLDDLALIANPDQAVALNNARMDLQVRSCVKFIPRRYERDFVFFTDLGPQIECWNMFDQTKGRVEVNAGPSCLEPMKKPYSPKRIFSDCDIEYINHLYNCPRRRKQVSPICPIGQNIMSRPLTKLHYTTLAPFTTLTVSNFGTKNYEIYPDEFELEEEEEEEKEVEEVEEVEKLKIMTPITIQTLTTMPKTTIETTHKQTTIESNNIINEIDNDLKENPRNHEENYPDNKENNFSTSTLTSSVEETKKTTILDYNEQTTTNEPEETTVTLETNYTTGTTKTIEDENDNLTQSKKLINTTTNLNSLETNTLSVNIESTIENTSEQTTNITPTDVDKTKIIEFSTAFPKNEIIFSSTKLKNINSTTLYPSTILMMTLITTSLTTTTLSPPPPDWVKKIEESFEHRENSETIKNNNYNKNEFLTNNKESESNIKFIENSKIINNRPIGLGNNFISLSNKNDKSQGDNNEKKNEIAEEENIINKPEKNTFSISKTKVITTIERSNYLGTCGSACTYSGDLVKLYRSYNDKMDISNHFYTTNRLEQHLMLSQGYVIQPSMGHLGSNHMDPACSCLKPLYRLYNKFMNDHLLTSTEQEKDIAERILGYKFESILGFCTKEPRCGAYMPLYRFYNAIAKDHLYTIDQQEMEYYKTHPEQAYGFEYIECYVWQHNSSTKSCPVIMED